MIYLDLETYSETDLRSTGVYRYAEDPSFEILMAAWTDGIAPVEVAVGEDAIREIPGLLDGSVTIVAHNAQFERVALSRLAGLPVGEYLSPESFHDTQAVAAERGYPLALETLAGWLGGEQKDSAGTRLINLFCKPYRGRRVSPDERPEQWADFIEYCRQDVVTLVDVHERLGDFPTEHERRVYLADQRVNDRGMPVDLALADSAVEVADLNGMVQEIEVARITGVVNPNSRDQMLAWLRTRVDTVPDLKAATVESLLAGDEIPADARRVLELRQELALVAAKKFSAAQISTSADDRLRGGYRFFGAHTGRWAGRGVQPHNMPREQLESDGHTDAAILDLGLGLGADAATLKALVRSLFIGPFTVVDYAAIEARVVAWLAGEQWALEAFYDGRDIYVETAQRMGGLTRFQGKTAVLALGYQGGVGSLRVMGAEGTDHALQIMVDQYRAANTEIVQLWRDMGEAFRYGGMVGVGYVTVEVDDDSRHVRLPSGRAISYHGVRWEWVNKTWPDGSESRVEQASFDDPRRKGLRVDTYGGRLTENITQAVARDLLAAALVTLDDEGHPVVGHVHDEIIVEGYEVEAVTRAMVASPTWAPGLPIDAEGFTCKRYRKG